MNSKNANGSPHVKVDIVSCDKFSAEVRDNLDANYKQALCHSSVPFTSLISWLSPAFSRGWTKKTDRQQDRATLTYTDSTGICAELMLHKRNFSCLNTHTSIQLHIKVHKPWLWWRKWARNTITRVRTSGLISILGSVPLLMPSLTAK